MPDLEADARALRREVGAVPLARDFVAVRGPEAFTFLQGQLSQDVSFAPGGSAWSWLLQPQGKVVALVRVLRLGEDDFVLDTDAGWGAAVLERLNRFKLRVKCELAPLEWSAVALRGPRAAQAAGRGTGHVAVADWPGLPGVDLVGPVPEPPGDVRTCSPEALEAARIEAGVPLMGRELDERTIPAESGVIDQAVSFTKGCYTGQELVARIDSRGGNVPRRLRGVVLAPATPDALPPAGAALTADGREVGRLTSVARSVERNAPVALAYVRRELAPPAEATVVWEEASVPGLVEALPLVS